MAVAMNDCCRVFSASAVLVSGPIDKPSLDFGFYFHGVVPTMSARQAHGALIKPA
jgi:hypothetical protein